MIGVAILGSGFMARTHAAAWAAHADRAALRVVASRTLAGAAAVADDHGAQATDDLADAIARDDVDVTGGAGTKGSLSGRTARRRRGR